MRPLMLATLSLALAAPSLAQPLTSAFTYQGELTDNGTPVAGAYDLEFRLYDSAAGVTQIGPTLCSDNLAVVNGRFTVSLDFGAQFAGQTRYLEVRVRPDSGLTCGNASGLTTLAPRTTLSAAPNAAFALSASTATNTTQLNGQPASFYTNAANLTGTLPNARTTGSATNTPSTLVLRDASGSFSGAVITATNFVGFGGNLTGLNAGNMTAGTLDNSRTSGTSINAPNTLVLRNGSGGFDAGNISATSLSGSGSAITALNASNISTGVLAATRGGTGLADQLPASAGQFLRSPAAGSWGIANLVATDLPAHTGDLAGSYSASIVDGLQGRAVSAAAPSTNQVLKWNGVAWAPGADLDTDTNTTYTAGNGLALSGTTFALSTAGATTGEVMKFNGTTWNAEPDTDTNTTYTAGAGLSLTGTTFAIATSGVSGGTAGVITDSTITSADLATDTASLAKITNSNLSVSGANIVAANNITADEFNYTANMTSYYVIPPSGFSARDGVATFHDPASAYPLTNSIDGLAAPIHLPNGCTIRNVTFYVVDNSTTANLVLSLITTNIITGGSVSFGGAPTSGNSPALQTLSTTFNHTVDNTTTMYSVAAGTTTSWSGASMLVRAVRIEYTHPPPAR
jgi:hypothetical protein